MCILLKYKISCFLLQLRPFSRTTRALHFCLVTSDLSSPLVTRNAQRARVTTLLRREHFCMPTKRGNWRSLPNINYLKPEFQKHARFSKNDVYSLLKYHCRLLCIIDLLSALPWHVLLLRST